VARSGISGFMIVRDAERQGYPFIEAARSALLACDELLVSDGYSTDRTWEGLLALQAAFGDRVQLFRDRWPDSSNRGEILSKMTNRVRRRCRGAYCLSIQANEIIEPAAAEELVLMPPRFPKTEMFALNFLVQQGPRLAWSSEWRRRLFKNIPDIVAVGDAFEVCNVLPRRSSTRLSPLSEPVRHYRALCPVSYVNKLRAVMPRSKFWDEELRLAEEALEAASADEDPVASFWARMRVALESHAVSPAPLIETDQVPGALRHLLGKWRYSLDDSLAALGIPAQVA
jgi:hypothetical protein